MQGTLLPYVYTIINRQCRPIINWHINGTNSKEIEVLRTFIWTFIILVWHTFTVHLCPASFLDKFSWLPMHFLLATHKSLNRECVTPRVTYIYLYLEILTKKLVTEWNDIKLTDHKSSWSRKSDHSGMSNIAFSSCVKDIWILRKYKYESHLW